MEVPRRYTPSEGHLPCRDRDSAVQRSLVHPQGPCHTLRLAIRQNFLTGTWGAPRAEDCSGRQGCSALCEAPGGDRNSGPQDGKLQ